MIRVLIAYAECIHKVKWRHSNLWSRYDLHFVDLWHDVVLCEVNW